MRELKLDKLPRRVLKQLDIETVFKASRSVVAAERLMLFRSLHKRVLPAETVARRIGIHLKYCKPFLDFLAYLGLLTKKGDRYCNSAMADRHFVRERSLIWTEFWSEECVKDFEALSVIEKVITTGRRWQRVLGKERKPDYVLARHDRRWARSFAHALYDYDKPDAATLARNLDLSGYRSLLDVGGGSGVMSFALVRAYPRLKARILDFKYVCDAAKEIIRKERLSHRVGALAGDMNKSIPSGFDVIMFWNVGYISSRVMKMAYRSLPAGGMIVFSCFPRSDQKAPSPGAFLHRYLSVRPKGQTKSSIVSSLKRTGFTSVNYRRIAPNLGLITGIRARV